MLNKAKMQLALAELNKVLDRKFTLIMGGGGAMVLAHNYPLSTYDIDAIPKDLSIAELDVHVKQVAKNLDIPVDWLNPYYSTFTHVLPTDYDKRLIEVFSGESLSVLALGVDDLLIMKCFAHRAKDIPHARALLKLGAKTNFVEKHIEKLKARRVPGCDAALEFLDEIVELQES